MADTSSYRISVVVPTFQRPDLLDRCLTALIRQEVDPATYEIIVVDDANSPETRQQVERWRQRIGGDVALIARILPREEGQCQLPCRHTIRYLPVADSHGPAAARNLGWRAASGEIIAFTDDDCLPTPGWLKAGVNSFREGVVGVSGRVIVPLSGIPTDYELNAERLAHSKFVTANCFYRRNALAAVGGFDERFATAWREDSDLMFTLLENNAKLLCVPEAVVVHPIRPAQWGISLRQQRKSMYNALLYKKHPVLYRQTIQIMPPWHYYCIVAAFLVALLSPLFRVEGIALIATSLWLGMTGRFCIQRLRCTSHKPRHILEMIMTSVFIPPLAVFWRLIGAIKFRVFFL